MDGVPTVVSGAPVGIFSLEMAGAELVARILADEAEIPVARLRDGNAHSPYNLPILLAGKGGNTIATGRHVLYTPRTPLCNLYVGMARRMGVKLDRFGDSTGELPGLSESNYKGVAKTW